MDFLYYLLLFVASAIPFIEIFTTIPVSLFLLKLDPTLTAIICFSGNALGIIGFVILGSTLKKRVVYLSMSEVASNKKEKSKKKKKELLERTFKRFGIFGVAIIIPILISSHAGVLFHRTLGVSKLVLLFWVVAGVAVWTVALTAASVWFPSLVTSFFSI
ncbi:small multi-drug export protein [Alkalicoccobacillus porphyridii]|uniref:DNA-binding protein n=1 Tax=Alkalicoccobacillus porphyridii TaxID=2597270 RepID=A0A553ZW92_9BACI|nr:small multi-drug export protein [Alkalicoccobacillus porphyridii]TSB45727.1 hypothetical protein FN960_14665 [Alkalicoccobacillus porphyridii]